jgi:hypothetical protein
MPAEFLMQQMAWREALDEAQDAEQVQALLDTVMQSRKEALRAASSCSTASTMPRRRSAWCAR